MLRHGMAGVFISYRRADCAGHAGRLYDRLVDRFGQSNVFMDIDAIEPGVDFEVRIDEAVSTCRVLIVLIGDDWLEITKENGTRRLDDPDDLVRIEVARGLQREGLRVIPVLVEGASMPAADCLPDELKSLARRNALELSDARWRYDVERLVEIIDRAPAAGSRPRDGAAGRFLGLLRRRTAARARALAALALLAGALLVAVALLDGDDNKTVGSASQPTRTATPSSGGLLDDDRKKREALELVSPVGVSAGDRRRAYGQGGDGGEGCGEWLGIIGFCSETGEVADVLRTYGPAPGSALASYLRRLQAARGSLTMDERNGLREAWAEAAGDPAFQRAQDTVREQRLKDAVAAAKRDGLKALGQLVYYASAVFFGSADAVHDAARRSKQRPRPPAENGTERAWLAALLKAMEDRDEGSHRQAIGRMQDSLSEGDLDLAKAAG